MRYLLLLAVPDIPQLHPGGEIINFADENNIDLVVMGTLGKTGLSRFLMGSVAEKSNKRFKSPGHGCSGR